jgi:hypothetical protein
MLTSTKIIFKNSRGSVLIISMIFILVFSALAVSMAAISGNNLQLADNQYKVNSALSAAQSGLECCKYFITTVALPTTNKNEITQTDAEQVWNLLCNKLGSTLLDGKTVPSASSFSDSTGSGYQIITQPLNYSSDTNFTLRFYRYTNDPNTIKIQSIGSCGQTVQYVNMDMKIAKENKVMEYAIATQCRVWMTGDSTIYGNIYSSWKYKNLSPFNITSNSKVMGTINTILSNINPYSGSTGPDLYAGTSKMPYDLETLDSSGNPEYDSAGNKIISLSDEIQGYCKGINYNIDYGDKAVDIPGLKLSDYDTSMYKSQTTAPADNTVYNYSGGSPVKVTEYFPHAVDSSGNPLYNQASSSGSLKLYRYVCQNKTLTNLQVKPGRNALFKNCTFEGILYVDNSTSANDIRFENCTFNGPIVTTPSTDTSSGWWQRNQLYFTGTETFQNQTSVPATILAPNFNVNLGNTDPTDSDNNVLTGAIVGGLVDVRGNAQIYGTIISMFDTSSYSSGYVSNIGATTDDGGSETTMLGDAGVITITPNPNQMLPSGIKTPIVIKMNQETYSEG